MPDARLASLDALYDKLDASFEASGISMNQLAYVAGVAPGTAKRVMERKDVRWSSFSKVCRALGYQPVVKVDDDEFENE